MPDLGTLARNFVCFYTSPQKKTIFDFRGIHLNIGISHHQIIGTELCSDQLWKQWWEPCNFRPMIHQTRTWEIQKTKNGTFVTSVVRIRNNANHADKTQNVYRLSLNRAVVSWQEIYIQTRDCRGAGFTRGPAVPRGPRGGAGRALAYFCGAVRVRAYDCGVGAGPRAVSYCGPLRACIAYAVQCLILLSIL